jgi:radical SAM-linked protein
VTKEFLYAEYERSLDGGITEDCRTGACTECGVCDHTVVTNRVFAADPVEAAVKRRPGGRVLSERPSRARLRFFKTGELKYLSHLELVNVLIRATRRAALPVVYSRGHHPHPRLSFSQPLPVGMESFDEFLDMELERGSPGPARIVEALNSTLPAGLKVSGAELIPLQLPSLSAMIRAQQYVIELKDGPPGLNIDFKGIDGFVRDFLKMDSILVHIERGARSRDIDIRPLLAELSLTGDLSLGLKLKSVNGVSVRPDEVLSRLFNLSKEEASLIPIRKTGTVL